MIDRAADPNGRNDRTLAPFEPGEREAPLWAQPFLGLGAALFAGALGLRRAAYRSGIFRRVRVERPVISVGNITAGGSGKTPFVILLVRRLEAEGLRVAVLSRGYGGAASKRRGAAPLIVSAGAGRTSPATAAESGDEPALIARVTNAAVVVAPDRAAAARVAIVDLGAQILLLDDGFQHLRLERDLDVVLVDANRPLLRGRLLPLGGLREPPYALERAGLLVLNRGFMLDPGAGRAGLDLGRAASVPRIEIAIVPRGVVPASDLGAARQTPSALRGKRTALIAAISRPHRFIDAARALGADVVHIELHRDHAWLSKDRLEAFARDAKALGAEVLLTTEKDAARFPEGAGADLLALAIEPVVTAGDAILESALSPLLARARSHAV